MARLVTWHEPELVPDDMLTRPNVAVDVTGLGEKEVRVIQRLVDRIRVGQERHGLLNPKDGRNWKAEAREELEDYAIYMAIDDLARES